MPPRGSEDGDTIEARRDQGVREPKPDGVNEVARVYEDEGDRPDKTTFSVESYIQSCSAGYVTSCARAARGGKSLPR